MALMDGRNQSETVRLPLVGVPKGTPSMLAREYTTLGPHRHQGRSLGCLPSIAAVTITYTTGVSGRFTRSFSGGRVRASIDRSIEDEAIGAVPERRTGKWRSR